ncbi:hypothetical protein LTR04_005428 [Oleoguttula sp. CCFEE 6159]|nr:hypothetical protein LTR04_005428 [Oleoguttula sp. CCFEE 6159]
MSSPPPLPPPRHINEIKDGKDPGWQWGNRAGDTGFGKPVSGSVKIGSSLLGSTRCLGARREDESERPRREESGIRRGSPSTTVTQYSQGFNMSEENSAHSDEDPEGQRSLEDSSQAYDKQLLSRIGGPNTPTRTSGHALLSSGAQEGTPGSQRGPLRPLSMPERRHTSGDSQAFRWPSMPSSGTVSPGYRSPTFDQSAMEHARSRLDCSNSYRGSYEQNVFMDREYPTEESAMRDLNINDRSPSADDYQAIAKAGLKRRASSPQREPSREERSSVSSMSGHADLYHRRSIQLLANRNSPVSRFHTNNGSVSSVSSLGPRDGSMASCYGLSAASSATSYSSEHLSPGALTPAVVEADLGPTSPYAASKPLNPSPQGSLTRTPHQRTPSENEPIRNRKMSVPSTVHSRQNSVSKLQGMFICECCPKKPKKFDSEDELRLHETEKQYTCQYCPNRFKNKNEAERHQNSLHLRRHSWSCAALAGVDGAFHPSLVHGATADVCGYCGEEFPNPPNWDVRAEHLNHLHKFGECNQAKKFFRADHFRQHLKHSHAGTSGKWTNMLENACMKDEPPPTESPAPVGSFNGMASAGINGPSPLKTSGSLNAAHEHP